jgi:hypothetical protein
MFKPSILALLLAVGSVTANADLIIPVVLVQPGFVSAEVCNTFAPVPVTCQIVSLGQLPNGAWIDQVTTVPIFPGQCGYSYNYAAPPFYFINGDGQANCF